MTRQLTGKDARLVLVGAIALGAILWLESDKNTDAVETGAAIASTQKPGNPHVDYTVEVNRLVSRTDAADAAALGRFQNGLEAVQASYATRFATAATDVAATAGDYRFIANLVRLIAYDHLAGGDRTGAYLAEHLGPRVDPLLSDYGREITGVMQRLDNDLARNGVQLATDLAAVGPSGVSPPVRIDASTDLRRALAEQMRNLQLDGTAVGVSLAFDVAAIRISNVGTAMAQRLLAVSSKQLARPIEKAAASMALPAADGPLPVGDVLAAVGLLWTSYDIWSLQHDFREDVHASVEGQFRDVSQEMRGKATEFAASRESAYKRLRVEMADRSLKNLEGRKEA